MWHTHVRIYRNAHTKIFVLITSPCPNPSPAVLYQQVALPVSGIHVTNGQGCFFTGYRIKGTYAWSTDLELWVMTLGQFMEYLSHKKLAAVKGFWTCNDQALLQSQMCDKPEVVLAMFAHAASHDVTTATRPQI